jgi:hypothetical protein
MRNKPSLKRYKWAGKLAQIAMGKSKRWGASPEDNATNDPLAWWCLTEVIASGGPK